MEFQGITGNFSEANAEALVVAVFKGDKPSTGPLKDLDKLTGGGIVAVFKSEDFKGDKGQVALLRFAPKGKVKARSLMLIGVGESSDYLPPEVAVASGSAVRYLRARKHRSFAFLPRHTGDAVTIGQFAAQGFVTSQFELDKYKTKDKNDKQVDKLVVCVESADPGKLRSGLGRGRAIGEAMNFTRDLANEPPNILTPTEMASRAQKMAKETGLKYEVLDEARMEKLGMGSLLSVSKGSEQPAKLIILRYTPAKSTAKKGDLLALVGKGITFETGGI